MIRKAAVRLSAACVLGAILASGAQAAGANVDELLRDMPTKDAATANTVFGRAIRGGARTITALCGRLIPPGTGDDTNVRYLLSGLSFHVARPGAERERAAFERAVIQSLGRARNREIKAFLIRLLQWPGGDEAARRIGTHLKDPSLSEAAAFALQYIGGDAAEEELLKALRSATDRTAGAISKALGALRCRPAARGLEKWARASDRDLRKIALYALAEIADPGSRAVLAARTKQGKLYDRSDAVANYLLFARRLKEDGRGRDAISVCRELLVKDAPSFVRCAAMADLTSISPRHALPELLTALDDKRPDVRNVAARELASIPGLMVTRKVIGKLEGASTARRVVIVGILARRRDSASVRACVKALSDNAPGVRLAAVRACAVLGTREALYALLERLTSKDAPVAKASREALGRVRGEGVDEAIGSGLAGATPEGKVAAIKILGRRRATTQTQVVLALAGDEAKEVRAAALDAMRVLAGAPEVHALVEIAFKAPSTADRRAAAKALVLVATRLPDPKECVDIVLKTMAGAAPAARPVGYGILAALGDEKALAVVLKATRSGSAQERAAAVRALAEWPDASAAESVVAVAEGDAALAEKVLLIRGAVRLVKESKLDGGARAGLCDRLLKAAPRLEERKLVVSCFAVVRHAAALDRVLALLGSRELATEAAVAAARIATPLDGGTVARPPHAGGLRKAADLVKGDLHSGIEAALRLLSNPNATNLAKGRPVKASHPHEQTHRPEFAVDGDTNISSAWWSGRAPSSLEIDLGVTERIHLITVFPYWDGRRYYQYKVELSTNGRRWKTVVDASRNTTPATPKGVAHRFSPTSARYVKLNVLKNSANPSIHIVEVRVFAEGTGPETVTKRERPKSNDEGFVPLFNGRDLTGWTGDTKGYIATDGRLICKPGGKLFTQDEYSDSVLRFEFKLTPGANNGLGIRTPLHGDPAYAGMELQILDDTSPKYARLQPHQYHGSIYGIVASKRGHQKPLGEWNIQEVTADGPKIKIVLNGATILDTDLSKIRQTKNMHDLKRHGGLRNKSGHIGFLGHGSVVEFRNIRLKDLTSGVRKPPPGFRALFNGRNLSGWKGLVGGNPHKRAKLGRGELAKRQAKADADMRAHWRIENGALVFDGKGHSLCTAKNYGDFEMYVDWKIGPGGDSGIYLRGAPQVQIWDPAKWPLGSGGLYNNRKNPSKPLVRADNPVGEWNTFKIKMVGDIVTVHLNDRLVVDNVKLENYWDRKRPLLPEEQIELQSHGSTLYFRNVFIREIPRK